MPACVRAGEIYFFSPWFHRSHNCLQCLHDLLQWGSYITSDCLIIKTPFQPGSVNCIFMHIYQARDKNSSHLFTLWEFRNIKSNSGRKGQKCFFFLLLLFKWILVFSHLFCFGCRLSSGYNIMSSVSNFHSASQHPDHREQMMMFCNTARERL